MTSNITATEKGRNLELTVGDPGDPESIVLTIKPLSSDVGARLLGLWAGIALATTDTAVEDANDLARTVIGAEWEKFESLRAAEQTDVINAAFFWNVQGGGIDLVNEMLRDGLPKAQTALASANGYAQEFSLLTTLLNGASANGTLAPAGTGGTTSQPGTDASSSTPTVPPTSAN
ncbi:hypothetical protein [Gryllotalpicola koreensis]|uniref:Uncharacterized protein n=1 Tax=Gryllotalpicola koreensis TaxID=993086 RepID=A0ABP8A2X9_9MICO